MINQHLSSLLDLENHSVRFDEIRADNNSIHLEVNRIKSFIKELETRAVIEHMQCSERHQEVFWKSK